MPTFPRSLDDGFQSSSWTTRDGAHLRVRPIASEDEPAMIAFHGSLSDRTVYSRYFSGTKLSTRIGHERLRQICAPDPLIEVVLIAETLAPSGPATIVAVARLCHAGVGGDAEAALLITDAFQSRGLGSEMFRRLLLLARERRAENVVAFFLASNSAMRHLCIRSGMAVTDADGSESTAMIRLTPPSVAGLPATAPR